MIPKIVHYCWFGGNEKPDLFDRCWKSWQEHLPEYRFIEWNEDSFDVDQLEYTSEAYSKGKFAFVSDYVRLYALKKYGGIYLDTDVEVLRPLDDLLNDPLFLGYENANGVNPGLIMGCIKNHPFLDELMDYYKLHHFVVDGCLNTYTTVNNATDRLIEHGLVLNPDETVYVDGMKIYAKSYFCPDAETRRSGNYGPKTYTAHHYSATWRDEAYNARLANPGFVAFLRLCNLLSTCAKKLLGEKAWVNLRNGRLRRIYDFTRGVK